MVYKLNFLLSVLLKSQHHINTRYVQFCPHTFSMELGWEESHLPRIIGVSPLLDEFLNTLQIITMTTSIAEFLILCV